MSEIRVSLLGIDKRTGLQRFGLDLPYRNAKGEPDHLRRVAVGAEQMACKIAEMKTARGLSISSINFADCLATYLTERGAGGFSRACYRWAEAELGQLHPDTTAFASAYAAACAKLDARGIAVNTSNNYRIVVRTVANYAHKTGRAGSCTILDYGLERGTERQRILTTEEQLSIENQLRKWDSHLLMPFLFAIENPIRKRDLFNLRRDQVKLQVVDGKRLWVVQFEAKKTRRTANGKICTLPNISGDLLRYRAGMPADCPWLFPMVGSKLNGRHTKLKPGQWRKIEDADKHWSHVLHEANVPDFHFHDLKHCAETYMLRQGFTYDQLRKLGIQMSPKTARIYDNRSAVEVAASVVCKDAEERRGASSSLN